MKHWICVQTVVGREFQVESELEQQLGYTVYLPRKRIDQWTKRKRLMTVEALFPSYLFVHADLTEDWISETDLSPIKQVADVMRIVRLGGQIAKLTDDGIADLRAREDSQGVHKTKHAYAEGDKVRVKSGPFQQYEAYIQTLGKHDRAVIELLQGNMKADVNLSDLQPAA